MNQKLVWSSFVVLSVLWASTLWLGYELLTALPTVMPSVMSWFSDIPMLLAVYEWCVQLLAGAGNVLHVATWSLWAVGQAGLLVLVWAALKFIPEHSLESLRRRLTQQYVARRF